MSAVRNIVLTAAISASAFASYEVMRDKHEGRKFVPYRDPVGILTVCAGITGKDVIAGKRYTFDECKALEKAYDDRMFKRLQCVGPLTHGEWVAYGDFAYNIGPDKFCSSTIARLIKQGRRNDACDQVLRWKYVAKTAKCVQPSLEHPQMCDCSYPQNAKVCGGIWTRRIAERDMCMSGLVPDEPERINMDNDE